MTDYPNETTQAAIKSAATGSDVYGPYDSIAALMEALDA